MSRGRPLRDGGSTQVRADPVREPMDDNGPALCCPLEERRHDLLTRAGCEVADVHRHKGLLRGFVIEGQRKRLLFWHRNGRLTQAAALPQDLRRVG